MNRSEASWADMSLRRVDEPYYPLVHLESILFHNCCASLNGIVENKQLLPSKETFDKWSCTFKDNFTTLVEYYNKIV